MFEQICDYNGKSISMTKILRTADVDCNGVWKLPAIMLDMQELAGQHCERAGFGFKEMRKNNVAWVLLKLEIRFYSEPRLLQRIKMSTVTGGSRRLYHYRYFWAVDADSGEKLFDAVTHWTIVDLSERKAVPFDVKFPNDLEDAGEDKEYDAPFEISRLKLKDMVFECEKLVVPAYCDYDINGHVNNASYGAWVEDALASMPNETDAVIFKRVSFVYKAEIPMGVQVKLLTHRDGDYFAIRVVSEDGEKTYFECEGSHGNIKRPNSC